MLQGQRQRADDRSMKMRKLGKGDDSELTKKLDKEAEKRRIKQESLISADDAKYDRIDKNRRQT